ncbi:hypothetical protein C4D60_Mb08t21100 [Musa balbisiana]|uniref:Uncharacterized protein n=1 Tax=Musa balbisiana TaxID=52838 RepID=A0A4S8K5C8_MUSBA|nr:hypothetical protein C4D60_Mb08t21100 [Musa balbisiana]
MVREGSKKRGRDRRESWLSLKNKSNHTVAELLHELHASNVFASSFGQLYINTKSSTSSICRTPHSITSSHCSGTTFNRHYNWVGAARTRTPSATNYDVHSPTWGDGKPVHLPSAMEATGLGHEPC